MAIIVLFIALLTGTATAVGAPANDSTEKSAVTARLLLESAISDNPYAITPHRTTYVLPLTYVEDPNAAPFGNDSGQLDSVEMKFQVSIKVPVARNLFANDRLAFGYTQVSLWQAYNRELSAPFRETNHEPELMYSLLTDRQLFGWGTHFVTLGLSHQSNGRGGDFSRSWNRIYLNTVFERGDWYIGFKPWWRVPESAKSGPDDSTGDDNPDIEKYMGNFELSLLHQAGSQTYGMMLRNNLRSENRGAVQLDWTYPLKGKMRGYVQLFNGYGESLIDYDHNVTRLGVGVMLVNWL